MKERIIKQTGFTIVGLSLISLWGGGEGNIPMTPVRLEQSEFPSVQQIREAINDGQYGCESILGVIYRVDTNYELGARECGDTKFINLSGMPDKYVLDRLAYSHEDSPVSVFEVAELQ